MTTFSKTVIAVLLLITLSGCESSGSDSEPSLPVQYSGTTHAVSELCGYGKEFFERQFNAHDLTMTNSMNTSMSAPVGMWNACVFSTTGGKPYSVTDDPSDTDAIATLSLGDRLTFPCCNNGQLMNTFVVDGISVSEVWPYTKETRPKAGQEVHVRLEVEIDKWYGWFQLWDRDDATVQAAAKTLVEMTRALKGPVPPRK